MQYNESIEIPFKIDNLTGTASLGKPIDFDYFLHNTRKFADRIAFNPERFPAIFIAHKNGKILLFRSGTLNILGCKSIEDINEAYKWLNSICSTI